jgi:hypothetical protein
MLIEFYDRQTTKNSSNLLKLQKPRRLNLKFMSAVNNDNKTNGNSLANCCSRGIRSGTIIIYYLQMKST